MSIIWKICLVSGMVLFAAAKAIEDEETEVRYYLEKSGSRMLEVVYAYRDSIATIVDCYAYGDKLVFEEVLRTSSAEFILLVEDTLLKMTDFCTYAKWKGILQQEPEEANEDKFGVFSGLFIYPGTKWCGAGNISESYDDLGPEEETDKCCRTHDHCNDSIPGRSSKYGLRNRSPVTRSHCDCDEEFHYCLQEANTRSSNRVGRLFFNFLCMTCFKKEYPVVDCLEYKGRWPFRRCQNYQLDEEEFPVWQFFDAKEYNPKDESEEEEARLTEKDQLFLHEHVEAWTQFLKYHHLDNTDTTLSSNAISKKL